MKISMTVLAALALAGTTSSTLAQVNYSLTARTSYQFGAPADHIAGPAGGPDTGFVGFINNSAATFTGVFSVSGTAGAGGSYSTSVTATLAPFASLGSISLTDESSNYNGFNPQGGNLPELGALIRFLGTVSDGITTQNVDLNVYDGDVHSGLPRVNPFGETVDSYVLQGGDSFGRDTQDDFEVSQAPGNYTWSQIPAPGATALLGLSGLVALRRRR